MFSTNSGEAVPGLAGLAGTIQVTCLILLVLGLVVALCAVIARKKMQQNEQAAGVMMAIANTGLAAATIASTGALVIGGSTLYQVNKVEAQKVEPTTESSECSESRTVTINAGVWEDGMDGAVELPEIEGSIVSGEAEYWPAPDEGCSDGTVDSCRMVHLTGTTGDPAAMTGMEKLDEWIPPKGDCADGDPEQVEFS